MIGPARTAVLCAGLALWYCDATGASTNDESAAVLASRSEQIRSACIANRRYICGRVLQVAATGLVVDSGYTSLLTPPFNHSWLTRANAGLQRTTNLVEGVAADSVAVGLVFLTDIPRRPKVRQYDYVVLIGYPAGQYNYAPLPGVSKPIRRFAAGLERAVILTEGVKP